MKPAVLLLLACLAAVPCGAKAAEWVKIHSLAERDQFFYDKTKLVIHGDEITYWKKVIFPTPQPFKGKFAASGLYRERIHCAEHTLKLISYLLYAPSGEAIEYISAAEGEAVPIIPDSLGDVFEKALCPLVRQKQEQARLKTQEEARLKAEAEARLKAQEEARIQALEEARLKAEAEAARPPSPEGCCADELAKPQQPQAGQAGAGVE